MAEGEKGRVFTGARARLLIDGQKVGYARNCNGREEIQYEPVEVLDNIEVEEHVPVRYRVTFSMSRVRIVKETLKSLGYYPKLGNNPGEHLLNILTSGTLTVAIEDNKTGSPIMILEQAKAQSKNFSVDASGMVAEDVDFVAIRMRDESEV